MMEGILAELAKQGILGMVAVLAIIVAYRKDRQVNALYTRLEQKTEKMVEKYHTLAGELKETIHTLCRTIDEHSVPAEDEPQPQPQEEDSNTDPGGR